MSEGKQRLIVISNRLPVSIKKDEDGGWVLKPSSGGLVAALNGMRDKMDFLWIGWPGLPVAEEEQASLQQQLMDEVNCVPVFLSQELVNAYYNGFSNDILWPLLHYFPDEMKFDESLWEAYQEANQAFADVVVQHAEENATVWVHDYQLMLLPGMLRQANPTFRLGFFLHIPFPSSEIFRILPAAKEILEAMMASDLVGFHTWDYARHFHSAVSALLKPDLQELCVISYEGRTVEVGVFPIGIEPSKFEEQLEKEAVVARIGELERRFAGKRVLLGVDRLDYIKGIPQKIEAYEMFLENNPEYQDSAVLVQIAVPSRVDVEEYQDLIARINELVGRINGRFGSIDHQPIQYLNQSVNFDELSALYRIADACIVTSIRDGMNLVSAEYIACQKGKHGVLVLSEFAGAHQSYMPSCISINPWDLEQVAGGLEEAMSMGAEERAARFESLHSYVTRNTASAWGQNFLTKLVADKKTPVIRTPSFTTTPGDELLERPSSPMSLKGKEGAKSSSPTSTEGGSSSGAVAKKNRMLVVANRLPVHIERVVDTHGQVSWSVRNNYRHPQLLNNVNVLEAQEKGELPDLFWVGWVGMDVAVEEQALLVEALHSVLPCRPIFLDPEDVRKGFVGFCKQYLWSLFHYARLKDISYNPAFWSAYSRINEVYAEAVVDVYEPGDTVFVQNYHLLVLPMYIRMAMATREAEEQKHAGDSVGLEVPIGLFVHTNWPSSELVRCIPVREQLLTGMLEANCIGFQTAANRRHFCTSCTLILGLESHPRFRSVDYHGTRTLAVSPMSLDEARVDQVIESTDTAARVEQIRAFHQGKHIVMSRDTVDHTKGIPTKLLGIERFLERHGEEWANKVVFVILAVPPKVTDSEMLAKRVNLLVGRINGTRSTVDSSPIQFIHHDVDFTELVAMYGAADCMLVTPLRDGMNMSTHEFVVTKNALGDVGSMVLSEFAGANTYLTGGALTCNPWDSNAMASRIQEALSMSAEERVDRFAIMKQHVVGRGAAGWLGEMTQWIRHAKQLSIQHPPMLNVESEARAFAQAKNRLLLLDYDGTLAGIVSNPAEAFATDGMMEALRALCAMEGTRVYVVSGRDHKDLDMFLSEVEGLGFSAEHGCFLKQAGESEWTDMFEGYDREWMAELMPVFEYYTERTEGAWIEKKDLSIGWHYRKANNVCGTMLAHELQSSLELVAPEHGLSILRSKKIVEVRPEEMHKGNIVTRLLEADAATDYVLCMGDDRTDEDMFAALKEVECATTVRVGKQASSAKFHQESVLDVERLLKALVEAGKGAE